MKPGCLDVCEVCDKDEFLHHPDAAVSAARANTRNRLSSAPDARCMTSSRELSAGAEEVQKSVAPQSERTCISSTQVLISQGAGDRT
jgi:hypothetical protein